MSSSFVALAAQWDVHTQPYLPEVLYVNLAGAVCVLQVRLIQGPPGTGKTTTTTRLLSVLGSTGQRTLSCAPTNVAVAEVALRYLAMVSSSRQAASSSSQSTAATAYVASAGATTTSSSSSSSRQQFADFCSSEHDYRLSWPGNSSCRALLSGDLLLVGNADKVDKRSSLAQVYLPARVERLLKAASGWEPLVKELLAALEDPLGFCTQRNW
jgi:hypothetical protein